MTETRAELIDRGWYRGFREQQDVELVSGLRCNKCNGKLYLEAWKKPNCRPKQFTTCDRCKRRVPF